MISREYARLKDRDRWDTDILDALAELRFRLRRSGKNTGEKVVYCDGFDITKVRVTAKGENQVYKRGLWLPYEEAITRI